MKTRCRRAWLLGAATLALGACAPKTETHDHAAAHLHDDHGHAQEVSFHEGRGLAFSRDARRHLGLQTSRAEPRALAPTRELAAQIFALGPPARATLRVDRATAEFLKRAQLSGARLARLVASPARGEPANEYEAILEIHPELMSSSAAARKRVGDFVTIRAERAGEAPRLSVPRTALLRSAGGTFVYVVNERAFLRVPVVLGDEANNFVEIAGGLRAGDEVVAHPVERLWLIELHLTKGGGHSH
jgi:hypothetical protein